MYKNRLINELHLREKRYFYNRFGLVEENYRKETKR